MWAATIRESRFGSPARAFAIEKVPTPRPGARQVLVFVMAAGINYNSVWAARGYPVNVIDARRRQGGTEDFHIGGSDASGVVWAVGRQVRNVRVGDRVVLSCGQWDEDTSDIAAGLDPMCSVSARIWGYETNYGSFAQFALVDEYQCHPKPAHLTWEAAAAYMLVAATAYRQLTGWPPNVIKPGDPVLIWGGAGGLGSMAIQITRALGGMPIAVVSSRSRAEHCTALGAVGVIDRTEFDHWGRQPDPEDRESFAAWLEGVKRFGRAIWTALGRRQNPKIVFEHSGAETFPTSLYVCDNAGMVVTCAGTSGYLTDIDLRYLWMRQKRIQGSHFANVEQCRAVNALVLAKSLDPCLSQTWNLRDIGKAHQMMCENRHPPGNMAVLVGAPAAGLTQWPW